MCLKSKIKSFLKRVNGKPLVSIKSRLILPILALFSIFLISVYAEVKIKKITNPDGSFAGVYTVNKQGVTHQVKLERNPDGSYKGIYVSLIDGEVVTDTMIAYSNQNAMIRYNPGTEKWEYTINGTDWNEIGSGGAETFLQLTDTPSDYSGSGGKILAVKSTEDGIEFKTISTSDLPSNVMLEGENVSLLSNDAGYLTSESDPVWTSDKPNYFNISSNTTDDITEGTTNKFYSTTLFNTDFASKTTDDLAEGTTNKYYSSSLFNTDFSSKTTDDLSEGTTNLYYTSARFDTDFSGKSILDLSDTPASYSGDGSKVLSVKSTEDGVEFRSLITSDLPSNVMLEGENISLLNNDAGFLTSESDPVFGAMDTETELEGHLSDVTNVYTNNDGNLTDDDLSDNSINDLSDVNISSPADGEALKYDSASGKWVNGAVSGGSGFDYKTSFVYYSDSNLASSGTYLSDVILVDTEISSSISNIYLLSSCVDTETSIVYYELYKGTLTGYETNLQGFWKLEEASGTRYDETDNNNDLTDYNTVGQATGHDGYGADFERDNQEYLKIDDSSQTGLDLTGSFTISCWIKPESIGGVWYFILGKRVGGSAYEGYEIGLQDTDGKIAGVIDNPSSEVWSYSTTTPSVGNWYHIVFRYNADTDTQSLWINGTKEDEDNQTYSLPDTTQPFVIGDCFTPPNNPFDGVIDEVAVWDRALTDDEIATLYSAGVETVAIGYGYTTKVADLTAGQNNSVSLTNDTGHYKLKIIGSSNLDFRGFTIFFK